MDTVISFIPTSGSRRKLFLKQKNLWIRPKALQEELILHVRQALVSLITSFHIEYTIKNTFEVLTFIAQEIFHSAEQPSIFGKRKFHANVGEVAKLICVSRGNPDPAFTWSWNNADNNTITIRQGEEISGYSVTTLHGNTTSQSTLEIEKVTEESWMTYRCEVVNAFGKSSAYISLSGKSKCFFVGLLTLKRYHCERDLLNSNQDPISPENAKYREIHVSNEKKRADHCLI